MRRLISYAVPGPPALSALPKPTLTAVPASTSVQLTAIAVTPPAVSSFSFYQYIGSSWVLLATQSSGSYNVTGLIPSVPYNFYVTQNTSETPSRSSAPVFASATPQSAVPAQVTGLAIVSTTTNTVSLSWTATPTATTYRVYRNGVLISTPSATAFTDTALTASTSYTYTVAAGNAAGLGPQSSAVIATTQATGSISVLAYLQSLMGGHGVLSGHHWDQFSPNVWDQFLTTNGSASPFPQSTQPSLPNISPLNAPIGGGTNTNTDKIPAVLGMWPNTLGMIADTITRAQALSNVNQAISLGFIPFLTWVTATPAGTGQFYGNGTEFGSSGVLTAGSSQQALFFSYCDDLAAFFTSCTKEVIMRPFVEMNLNYPGNSSGAGHWYCTGGSASGKPSNAQFIQLWQLAYNRIHGAPNNVPTSKVIWCYAPSLFSGSFSANFPGTTYAQVAGPDTYINTGTTMTQASFNSTLAGQTVSYFQGLGIPIFFPECGGGEPQPADYTTNSALFGGGVQTGSGGFSNFVCGIFWPQQWGLSYQLNAIGYMNSCINYGSLPVFA